MATWEPTKKRRKHPYYKVQVYNETSMTWKDERGAFDTVDEAQEFIAAKAPRSKQVRIMVVEVKRRFPIELG